MAPSARKDADMARLPNSPAGDELGAVGATAMNRKKATDFPPPVLKLFDGYIHGAITRREFLKLGAAGTGGVAVVPLANPLGFDVAAAKKRALDLRILAMTLGALLSGRGLSPE